MGDQVRSLLIALIAFCHVGSAAQAQEIPPVFVMAEEDDENARTCQVSNASIGAAVESEFTYNRVPIGTVEQYLSDKAINSYVRTTILVISGTCAISTSFSLKNDQPVVLSVTGKAMFATVEICNKGGLLSGPTHNMQSRLNAAFRDYTSQCNSEYRKKGSAGVVR